MVRNLFIALYTLNLNFSQLRSWLISHSFTSLVVWSLTHQSVTQSFTPSLNFLAVSCSPLSCTSHPTFLSSHLVAHSGARASISYSIHFSTPTHPGSFSPSFGCPLRCSLISQLQLLVIFTLTLVYSVKAIIHVERWQWCSLHSAHHSSGTVSLGYQFLIDLFMYSLTPSLPYSLLQVKAAHPK